MQDDIDELQAALSELERKGDAFYDAVDASLGEAPSLDAQGESARRGRGQQQHEPSAHDAHLLSFIHPQPPSKRSFIAYRRP